MSGLKILAPIVHYCDWSGQGDIRIYCSQKWTGPEWGSAKGDLVSSGIFVAKDGSFYSFGMSNVNCSDCLDKRNLEDALE